MVIRYYQSASFSLMNCFRASVGVRFFSSCSAVSLRLGIWVNVVRGVVSDSAEVLKLMRLSHRKIKLLSCARNRCPYSEARYLFWKLLA